MPGEIAAMVSCRNSLGSGADLVAVRLEEASNSVHRFLLVQGIRLSDRSHLKTKKRQKEPATVAHPQ